MQPTDYHNNITCYTCKNKLLITVANLIGLWDTINEYKYHTSRKTYSSVTSEQPSDFPIPENNQGIRTEWFHKSSVCKWVFSVFGQRLLVAHMSHLDDVKFSTAWRQSQMRVLLGISMGISRTDFINVARRLVWLTSYKIRDNCSIGVFIPQDTSISGINESFSQVNIPITFK